VKIVFEHQTVLEKLAQVISSVKATTHRVIWDTGKSNIAHDSTKTKSDDNTRPKDYGIPSSTLPFLPLSVGHYWLRPRLLIAFVKLVPTDETNTFPTYSPISLALLNRRCLMGTSCKASE
jgi:hypothetical protein